MVYSEQYVQSPSPSTGQVAVTRLAQVRGSATLATWSRGLARLPTRAQPPPPPPPRTTAASGPASPTPPATSSAEPSLAAPGWSQ